MEMTTTNHNATSGTGTGGGSEDMDGIVKIHLASSSNASADSTVALVPGNSSARRVGVEPSPSRPPSAAQQRGFQEKAQQLSLRIASSGQGIEPNAHITPQELSKEIAQKSPESMETDIHFVPLNELFKRFRNSNVETGLTDSEVQKNREEWGVNKLTPPKRTSYIVLFAMQLISGFNFILWLAAIVIFLSWQPLGSLQGGVPQIINVEVAVVLVIVILWSAIFSFYQEVTSMKIVESFNRIVPNRATVLRNGRTIQLDAEELVVGDIVMMSNGEKVPADLRIIKAENAHVDNSALTGESEPVTLGTACTNVNYLESTNLAFFTSLLVQGSLTGLVVNVGDRTILGSVNQLTQSNSSQDTSLHREIRRFVWIISGVALFTGCLTFIGWGAWLYEAYPDYMPVSAIILNAISLIVAYVPEGLPVCVTTSLTMVARRMMESQVLVTNLAIVETFNSVSVIATDKTGTLTQNKMSVTSFLWGLTSNWQVPIGKRPPGSDKNTIIPENVLHHPVFQLLLSAAALCNNANKQTVIEDGISTETVVGDAADTALFNVLSNQLEQDVSTIRQLAPRIAVLPFNSSNKFMISFNENAPSNTPVLEDVSLSLSVKSELGQVFLKGAPEIVLGRCNRIYDEDGASKPLTEADRSQILAKQETLGKLGYRVIAVGYQVLSIASYHAADNSLNGLPGENYAFVGMFTLLDPPREAVPSAVIKARKAGIRVFMITGDHPSTAQSIALQTNIFTNTNLKNGHHSLRFTQDQFGRACALMLRNGLPFNTHVLGSDTSKTLDENELRSLPVPVSTHAIIDNIRHIVNAEKTNELSWKSSNARGPSNPTLLRVQSKTETEGVALNSIVTQEKEPSENGLPEGIATHDSVVSLNQPMPGLYNRIMDWVDPPQIQTKTIPYSLIITGSDIPLLDDALWGWVLSHQEVVFARTSPEQKLRVVMELQARDEVVAVTGDGVNDAPALKRGDIGVAMFSGVEVAREAGDMILLDNDFSSLIKAIEIGRLVSDNLKKVCLYLLPGSTWSEMWPVMFNVFIGVPLALSSFEMIVCSVVTDVFDALALVQESPEENIMIRPPIKRSQSHLVNFKLLWHAYVELGFIISLCAFFNFFWYMNDQGLPPTSVFIAFSNWGDGYTVNGRTFSGDELVNFLNTGQSIYFVSLVTCNFFNMYATRTRYSSSITHNPFYGPSKNWWLILAMILSTCSAILLTQAVWFQETFLTAAVPVKYVCPSLGFGAFLFLFDELRKWWARNYPGTFWARLAW